MREPQLIRSDEVSVVIAECDVDGRRVWFPMYRTVIDDAVVMAPVKGFLGGGFETPQEAVNALATRSYLSI